MDFQNPPVIVVLSRLADDEITAISYLVDQKGHPAARVWDGQRFREVNMFRLRREHAYNFVVVGIESDREAKETSFSQNLYWYYCRVTIQDWTGPEELYGCLDKVFENLSDLVYLGGERTAIIRPTTHKFESTFRWAQVRAPARTEDGRLQTDFENYL